MDSVAQADERYVLNTFHVLWYTFGIRILLFSILLYSYKMMFSWFCTIGFSYHNLDTVGEYIQPGNPVPGPKQRDQPEFKESTHIHSHQSFCVDTSKHRNLDVASHSKLNSN